MTGFVLLLPGVSNVISGVKGPIKCVIVYRRAKVAAEPSSLGYSFSGVAERMKRRVWVSEVLQVQHTSLHDCYMCTQTPCRCLRVYTAAFCCMEGVWQLLELHHMYNKGWVNKNEVTTVTIVDSLVVYEELLYVGCIVCRKNKWNATACAPRCLPSKKYDGVTAFESLYPQLISKTRHQELANRKQGKMKRARRP